MRCVRSASVLPMALMCSTSMVGLCSGSGGGLSQAPAGAPILARNALDAAAATSSGWSWCSMWPAGATTWRSTSAHDVQALVELGLGVAVAPPDADVGAVALDPQHRRGDALPAFEPSSTLVRASGSSACGPGRRGRARPAVVAPRRRDQCGASQAARSARSSGLVLLQPLGDAVEARRRRAAAAAVFSSSSHLRDSASAPAAGCDARHAEAFEVDEAAHALGPHAGIEHRDVAAHAVAEQVDRRALGAEQRVEHGVEVAEVVGEPVGVGGRRVAERRSRASRARARGGRRRSASTTNWNDARDVHPAVQHDQRRPVGARERGVAPLEQVVAQAAHR